MKIKYLIYTITLISLAACGDFLEPKSQSQYIPKDANALQEMLIGEAYPRQQDTKFLNYLEILTDDIEQNQVEVTDSQKMTKQKWKFLKFCIAGNPICSKYERSWDTKRSIHGKTYMNIF